MEIEPLTDPNKKTPTMSAFETAVADSKKLTSKPSNDDLLFLYGMPVPRIHIFAHLRELGIWRMK
jgi:hypothetical protein